MSRGVQAALPCGIVVAVLGYALHRLAFAAGGEPDPRVIVSSAHVGFYWRVATCAWWAAVAAAAGWRWPTLGDIADRALLPSVAVATLIAVLVP